MIKNGLVKDMMKMVILYKGEYLNGERNGRGKEYKLYHGKIVVDFDGEYINGERKTFRPF